MNYWSPDSSASNHDQPERLQTFTTDNEFSDPYGMNILPPSDPSAMQHSLPPSEFFTHMAGMAGMDNIKSEMPDWDMRASSTPNSDVTPNSDLLFTAASRKVRSAKSRRNNSASTDSSGMGPSTDLSREKNRIAASKCRRKKKVEEQQLEERRRMLQVQHAILQDSAAQLRNEVLHLKNEILKHGTCDYPPIQNYIKQAASQLR
ncbi:hypothetical protein TruAng_009416 [Truncatella angustata]|nr:hypothetical protein TruAng_009416 [Truncatella angustata]